MGDNVIFKSHNAGLNLNGSIGKGCSVKTHNGEINTGDVGENTTLMTHNGDITCGNVGTNASVKTHNGDVHAGIMGERTSATSHNGDVRVDQAPKSADLDTHNGNVYVSGVKRKKEKAQGASFSIGGMSFIGGGRVIVNGQDITSLIQGSGASSSSREDDTPPVRYTKFG